MFHREKKKNVNIKNNNSSSSATAAAALSVAAATTATVYLPSITDLVFFCAVTVMLGWLAYQDIKRVTFEHKAASKDMQNVVTSNKIGTLKMAIYVVHGEFFFRFVLFCSSYLSFSFLFDFALAKCNKFVHTYKTRIVPIDLEQCYRAIISHGKRKIKTANKSNNEKLIFIIFAVTPQLRDRENAREIV